MGKYELAGSCDAPLAVLLARQAALYAGADNTSISAAAAQRLLQSIVYTLQAGGGEACAPEAALARGQEALRAQLRRAKRRWQILRCVQPPVENAYYAQTLRELGVFFARYDVRFGAHEIPCSIDYPLLCPVPEQLQGVGYVEAYLARLQLEAQLLQRFDRTELARLYARTIPEYEDFLFNFCEPALLQAVGRMLAGLAPDCLCLPPQAQAALCAHLQPLSGRALRRAVCTAAETVCTALGLEAAAPYFQAGVQRAVPRLYEALRHGAPDALFPVLAHDDCV